MINSEGLEIVKRGMACEQLINEYTESPPVCTFSISLLRPMYNLRCQILRRATKCKSPFPIFESFREPKISNLDVPVPVDKQVLWFEIAVDHGMLMHVGECEQYFSGVEKGYIIGKAAVLA